MSSFVDRIAARLGERVDRERAAPPALAPGGAPGVRRAAVAAVLHDEPGGARVLLMERVVRDGDPWSGHISLPGGGYQAGDASLLETAVRETREELNVDLAGARRLGPLPVLTPRLGSFDLEISPFVFATAAALEPVPGPEARGAFWLPLSLAASGALDAAYRHPGYDAAFPSWQYDGRVIWGLTWRILRDLLAAADEPGAPQRAGAR